MSINVFMPINNSIVPILATPGIQFSLRKKFIYSRLLNLWIPQVSTRPTILVFYLCFCWTRIRQVRFNLNPRDTKSRVFF